jgi:transcription elongation factor Elf1
MQDRDLLLCLRVADSLYSQKVPGSAKLKCEFCGHDVIVSPVSLQVKERKNAMVICMQCSLQYIRTDANALKKFVITPEQIKEAEKAQEDKKENILRN